MFCGEEVKKWNCGKAGVINFQKVRSLVRDLSKPCLSQSQIKIGKMLKPEKWQAYFDSEGKVFGFQKALRSIILGGVDPSIRAEVWEFLLGCYALSSTSEYRKELRVTRRERYNELLKQCQTMNSSVGTGGLAYVVGSKVMDMRKSHQKEVENDSEDESTEACNENTENHDDCSNNGTETSHVHRRGNSSESVDLVSGRESHESTGYDTSPFVTASSTYSIASPDPYVEDGFYGFPSLPLTDLFEWNSFDKKEVSSSDEDVSVQSELRYEDEEMQTSQIDLRKPSHSGSITELVDDLRIQDAPQIPSAKDAATHGGAVKDDRTSEWLWTLHKIVVDVVRTDNQLKFYQDRRNLGRMSDILAVYAWVDPSTGYCQGMSDLVSPFVVLFEDNADAFWCFEMLIRKTRSNYQIDGPTGVMNQLESLWHILQHTDKEIFSHLSCIGAESLHFAFRMLLVLFRRELSFNEVLKMWEMMWAADFDESITEILENDCLEPLVVQLPKQSETEFGDNQIDEAHDVITKSEPTSKSGRISKSGPLPKSSLVSKSGLLPKSGPLPKTGGALPKTGQLYDDIDMKLASSYSFCGLSTKSFWSKHERTTHASFVVSSFGKETEPFQVFCVAAIIIMNRHKIMKEARSIDDMIKIFNDKLLAIRVRRCIRTAIKLRKKYMYKNQVTKIKSHTHSQNQSTTENQSTEQIHQSDDKKS